MSKIQKTVKIDDEIYDAAEHWMQQSGGAFNFSSLTEAAIRKFITEPQTFEPVVLQPQEAMKLVSKAMRKHKKALDRMK